MPWMKCRLTNLSENKHLRTDVVEGWCQRLPEVSTRFMMTAKSLDLKKDFRVVSTTPVQEVLVVLPSPEGYVAEFKTMNTHYTLEVWHE